MCLLLRAGLARIFVMTCIVLAGGPRDAVAQLDPDAPNKAFLPVGGVPLVERTLGALRAAPSVGRIIVVAPESAHNHAALRLADEVRADGRRIRDSLRSGLSGLPQDELVLVTASDLPVLTAASIEDFVARARCCNAALVYGCVERSVHERKFPGVPHTWARLRDGVYCGTGFVAMKPLIYSSLERFIERLGHARKNPLRLASLFGWDVLLRFLTRSLSIGQAEARASALLDAPVRAAISPYPELAVNVDRVSDVALWEQPAASSSG
ncbi:MAG: NTP transferase domain-containing protein [Candidatus Eremiobacteraeota bacterium]|nr:NTP transferase domain-containing protein [Candidatus Eremiobacteraeota bacterium]